eukprot:3196588-Prymnesium_polylepis.1
MKRRTPPGPGAAASHGLRNRLVHVDDVAVLPHPGGHARKVSRIIDARVRPARKGHALRLEHRLDRAVWSMVGLGKQRLEVAPLVKVGRPRNAFTRTLAV